MLRFWGAGHFWLAFVLRFLLGLLGNLRVTFRRARERADRRKNVMGWLEQLHVLGEVALAMVLGGAIGFEREAADKPAGFRTQMLVAGAAALLVALSSALIERFGADAAKGLISADPIRIVQGIIIGIAFIGGGTIFRKADEDQVEGLTTAASLLLTGGIGIAVALRQFVLAAGTTLLAIIVLRILAVVEHRLKLKRDTHR